jgi:ParB/RepB/Spo0J family partition protein
MVNKFQSPLQKAVVSWLAAHPETTIAGLAQLAGIDKGDLSKITRGLKGSLNMEPAGRLAKAMGTTVEGLLSGEPEAAAAAPAGAPPNAVRVETTEVASGTRVIALKDIEPSADNPRKTFDEESLKELAASIAEQGLLQPIVVRPVGKRFEIIAGERRFRALKLNKTAEALCVVREGDDDGTTKALRIIENLQREDISPAEEADALLALHEVDPKKWNATAIGRAIGRSDRFVGQRLDIARNLAPGWRKRLVEGTLKIELARALAAWPQKLQTKVHVYDHTTAAHIQRELENHVIPAGHAAFDHKLYTGEIVSDGKRKFFADAESFDKLQAVAAEAKADKLAEEWPGAAVVKSLNGWVWADNGEPIRQWADKREAKSRRKGLAKDDVTALVTIENRKVVVYKGVLKAALYAKKAEKTKAERTEERERQDEKQAHKNSQRAVQAFREDLQARMAGHPGLVKRLIVYATMGNLGDLVFEDDPGEFMGPWKEQLAGIVEFDGERWDFYDAPDTGEDRLWTWLCAQPDDQIELMLARLVGLELGVNHWTRPNAVRAAVYASIGATLPADLAKSIEDENEDDEDLEDLVDESDEQEPAAQEAAA